MSSNNNDLQTPPTTDPVLVALAQHIGRVDGKVDGVKSAVDQVNANVGELRSAVTTMARLEISHTEVRGLQQVQQQQINELRAAQEKQEGQLSTISSELGPLKETRSWVIKVLSYVVTAVVIALIGLVVVKPNLTP